MVKTITSSEDLKIYDNNKHLKIYAGPGAGKTHLLIENIKFIITNSLKLRDSNRKILCITYTNAAADEIKKRLGSYNRYVFVSTIHSFLSEFVIRPHQVQLKKIIKDEFGYEVSPKINITSQQEGYSTLKGHKKDEIYEWISKNYNKLPPEFYNSLSKSRMSDVIVDISPLNTYMSLATKEKIKLTEIDKVTNEVGIAIKEYIWGVAGKIHFDEILYFGLRLLEEYNHILHMLRVEFPYILIDEYQDTNPIQNKIVRIITQKECIMAAIGDIAQSIYSFQGATYREFENLKLDSLLPIETYVIKNNRRSTQNIIDLLNYIRKSDTELNDQKCEMNKNSNEKVTFLIQRNPNVLSKDLDDIIGTEYKVLCRRWAEAFDYVKDIDPEQKKLLNAINSAYTYVMHRDLATEIEAKQEKWINSAIYIAKLEDALKRKCIPSALNFLEKFIDVEEILNKYDSVANEKFIKVINVWEKVFKDIEGTLLLKDVIKTVNKAFDDSGLPIIEYLAYPEEEDDDYIEAVYKYVDRLNLAAVRKLVREIFSVDSKYMTIHRAKGTEHKVVLVNLEPFRDESKLFSPVDILCNPEVLSNNTKSCEVYKEFTRITYVGCSRAIDELYIHLLGDETVQTRIETSIKAYYNKTPEKCGFYKFELC